MNFKHQSDRGIRHFIVRNGIPHLPQFFSADWTDADGEGWTVAVGCGLYYVFRIAKQPMQISIEGY